MGTCYSPPYSLSKLYFRAYAVLPFGRFHSHLCCFLHTHFIWIIKLSMNEIKASTLHWMNTTVLARALPPAARNLHLSQIPFSCRNVLNISVKIMQSGHLFFFLKGGGGRKDKNWDLQHRMGGELFLPTAGLSKISFCLLPSLNLKSYYISLNNPTL